MHKGHRHIHFFGQKEERKLRSGRKVLFMQYMAAGMRKGRDRLVAAAMPEANSQVFYRIPTQQFFAPPNRVVGFLIPAVYIGIFLFRIGNLNNPRRCRIHARRGQGKLVPPHPYFCLIWMFQ